MHLQYKPILKYQSNNHSTLQVKAADRKTNSSIETESKGTDKKIRPAVDPKKVIQFIPQLKNKDGKYSKKKINKKAKALANIKKQEH